MSKTTYQITEAVRVQSFDAAGAEHVLRLEPGEVCPKDAAEDAALARLVESGHAVVGTPRTSKKEA
jgi:hypothetical protein